MNFYEKAVMFRGPEKVGKMGKKSVAASQHGSASRGQFTAPGFGAAIRDMVKGWARYAAAVQARYGEKIGDDGVLGEEWAKIGDGLLGLLNGELGGFDAGSLDANIRDLLRENGVTLED